MAYAHVRMRRAEVEPEPKPVSNWIYVPDLTGCILGLAVLPIGVVWNAPIPVVVLSFGFVLGLAVLDHPD